MTYVDLAVKSVKVITGHTSQYSILNCYISIFVAIGSATPAKIFSIYGHVSHLGIVTWPRGYKTFSCSTQLSLKFILLINVKMPTIVGILTFISRRNYQFLRVEPEFSTNFDYFSIDEQLKFHAQLS